MEVYRVLQENFQCEPKKFCVAWHSSQIPEQKEVSYLVLCPSLSLLSKYKVGLSCAKLSISWSWSSLLKFGSKIWIPANS